MQTKFMIHPISLVHSPSKLISKTLSRRLTPHMCSLSTFIKGRALHDNFRTVQLTAKSLHAHRRPYVLMKVDIVKAFDTVSWLFLFDVLQHMGFSQRWINWLSILFSSASTRILLNGTPGGRICHAQGLRQGDPLALLLFILAMEVLHALFRRADEAGLLTPLQLGTMKYTVFLYADDMVIFLASVQQDARVVRTVLELFVSSSGLRTNISLCMLTPIRCGDQLPM
jgi:hypothetical protein